MRHERIIYRERDFKTEKYTDRETKRQTDKQTERQTDTYTPNCKAILTYRSHLM
jgi:hypothetical protein